MDFDLRDKTLLITGGLGALAECVLKKLAAVGANLVITDRKTPEAAATILAEWGLKTATYFQIDVTSAASVEQAVRQSFEAHPEIDIALGHAGGTGISMFEDLDAAAFDQIVAFNFIGQTYFARAVLREWRQRERAGHLIFTSSYVSRIPMAGISAYTASKAALEMFAKNLALEYAAHGIRVNCIAPGNVATGSSALLYDSDEAYRHWVDRVSPLGSRNSPEGIANAFLYLCSPLANEVDGHVLQVDMGVGLPKLG